MPTYKKINKNGGITIPQQLRHELGFKAGVPLEIVKTENGIELKKYVLTCMSCGSAEKVVEVGGFAICTECAEKVLRGYKASGE